MTGLKERLIEFTRRLIEIPSTDANPADRARCFAEVREHLAETPGLVLTSHESNGYESLVAMPVGVSRPEILLNAHLDVVQHPDPADYVSQFDGARIHGPGAGDMKGQLVILLELMRHIQTKRPGAPVGLAITSDEEIGGENGLRFLVEERGLRCGVAIIADGGSLTDVTVEEKGILHLRAHCAGESGHAARPWLCDNPIDRLCDRLRILRHAFDQKRADAELLDEAGPHWFPTCSVTGIDTPNESPNRIPDHASAVLDVRFPRGRSVDEMIAEVQQLLGPEIDLTKLVTAEPTHLDPDPLFIEATRQIAGAANLVKASGGSDSRFLAAHGIPVMLSRPLVGNLHGHDEWIDVESMLAYFRICCRYFEARLGLY